MINQPYFIFKGLFGSISSNFKTSHLEIIITLLPLKHRSENNYFRNDMLSAGKCDQVHMVRSMIACNFFRSALLTGIPCCIRIW